MNDTKSSSRGLMKYPLDLVRILGQPVNLREHPSWVRVRCITLNLEGLEHNWFGARFRIVVAGLRKYRPDVVCLQESTVRYADGIYNQAQAIGDAADLNSVAFYESKRARVPLD